MARLLLLVVLGVVVFLLVRALRRAGSPKPMPGASKRDNPGATMIACAHCGVHIPESEALHDRGQTYCCAAHRQRGPAGQ